MASKIRHSSKLQHIYFFLDGQAHSDGSDRIEPSVNASNGCASPSSDVSAVGSSDTLTRTSSSNISMLDPTVQDFKPTATALAPANAPQHSTASKLYELRKTQDRGSGLFATGFIPLGTRIVCETPLLTIADDSVHLAWGPYCRLSNAHKQAYDALCFYQPNHLNLQQASRFHLIDHADDSLDAEDVEELVADQVRVMGIFAVNNFKMPGTALGVYEITSRLNHSCVPNVHHSYNPTLKMLTVHTARDIMPGEELLTTYLGGQATYYIRAQRIKMLRQTYGFVCQCVACADRTGQSDRRREFMASLAYGLQQYTDRIPAKNNPYYPASPFSALKQAEDLISSLMDEGLLSMELLKAYRIASKLALELKNFQKAAEYANVEAKVERNCLGTEVADLDQLHVSSTSWIQHIKPIMAAQGIEIRPTKPLLQGQSLKTSEDTPKARNAMSAKEKARRRERRADKAGPRVGRREEVAISKQTNGSA